MHCRANARPANGPRVDYNSWRLSKLGMCDARERNLAERRAPLRRRMNRNARERNAVGRANDDDSRRGGSGRRAHAPNACRSDRTRISEASVRRR